MKSFLTLKSVDEVLSLVETFERLPEEYVPLDESAGRYLALDWSAPEDLPGFDRSTVDGYAVRARDVFGAQEGSPALLECVGECPMGKTPDFSLAPGQTARIFTGGMLPEGADCVVMVEYSRQAGGNLVELVRTQAPAITCSNATRTRPWGRSSFRRDGVCVRRKRDFWPRSDRCACR